jgi:hypothetical protein
MSAIGMANNTNTEGFSFMDMMNFTGELKPYDEGRKWECEYQYYRRTILMPQCRGGSNNGIRTVWGGGLNYNNIIGSKVDFTSNYFYNHLQSQNSIPHPKAIYITRLFLFLQPKIL